MRVPGELIPIVMFICVAVSAIGVPIARAWAKRLERGPMPGPSMSPDVQARLERMEQALDSIAIEVERISEGQRFTTKLLAERNNNGAAAVPTRQQ
jgi:hypothetical protein